MKEGNTIVTASLPPWHAFICMMQTPVYFQARDTAFEWSAGDTIPFRKALGLSLVAVGASIARVCGCYLLQKRRWWHLGICFISFAPSACLLGVVFSRVDGMHHPPHQLALKLTDLDNQRNQKPYFALLLFECSSLETYEVAATTELHPFFH
jgi:hypothetical protein